MEEEKHRGSMGGCASPAPPALQPAGETVGLKGGDQEPSTHLCRCVLRKIRVLLAFRVLSVNLLELDTLPGACYLPYILMSVYQQWKIFICSQAGEQPENHFQKF